MKKIDLFKERIKAFLLRFKGAFRERLKALKIKERVKAFDVKKNKMKLFFVMLALLVVLLIFARSLQNIAKALFKKEEAKAPVVEFEEGLSPIKALKIKKMDFKDTLPVMGNIKGFKEVELKFQTNGIIESINFEEGERIQEGDIIANLVQKDALLKLNYSDIEMKKAKKLFEIGAIDKVKLDQTKLEYDSARSELDKTNIYAVSNGLMGSRVLDVGNFVTPNDRIGVFIDISKVYADFNVIEKDMAKIALKQKVDVFVDAYPNKSFNGKIDRIAPIVEGRSRTQNIKVELDNKDGLLKPGMFTRALIYTYEKKDALVIPTSSLKKQEEQYLVYVVHKEEQKEAQSAEPAKKEKEAPKKAEQPEQPAAAPQELGTIEVRPIKVGYMTQDMVEVEEGLSEEELIVVEVYEEYKDKAKVEIMEVQEGLF